MTIRKIQRCNKNKSLSVVIPARFCKEIGLTGQDNVNVEIAGNTLHISKVVLQ